MQKDYALVKLTVATRNPNKAAEIRSALAGLEGWAVCALPDSAPSIEETGETFLDNAKLKATHFSVHVDGLVIAEDSGLCIDALGGRPGVYSARYAGDDAARIARVLAEMKDTPDDRRQARFVCALALAERGNVKWTAERSVEGVITRQPSGAHGFGYDPIFRIPALGRTMAELTLEEKNRISHRGQAIRALADYLGILGTSKRR